MVRIHIYPTFRGMGKNLIDVESRRVAKKWSPEAAEGRRTGNLGYVEDVRGSRYSTER